MPRPSARQRSLAAAQAQCADWEPVLEGQLDILGALDEEGALEEVSKTEPCRQRKEDHRERHAD